MKSKYDKQFFMADKLGGFTSFLSYEEFDHKDHRTLLAYYNCKQDMVETETIYNKEDIEKIYKENKEFIYELVMKASGKKDYVNFHCIHKVLYEYLQEDKHEELKKFDKNEEKPIKLLSEICKHASQFVELFCRDLGVNYYYDFNSVYKAFGSNTNGIYIILKPYVNLDKVFVNEYSYNIMATRKYDLIQKALLFFILVIVIGMGANMYLEFMVAIYLLLDLVNLKEKARVYAENKIVMIKPKKVVEKDKENTENK